MTMTNSIWVQETASALPSGSPQARANCLESHDDSDDVPLGDPARILIVDDDATARLTLSCLLADQHYHIVTSASAEDARERMDVIRPDVILCDLVMRGANGDQFCRWLKEHVVWRYVPVIAITQLDNPLVTSAMLDAGADEVVIKPVRKDELQARVLAALRIRDRYLELARVG